MLSGFSESLGDKLADSWMATVLTPAFAFWGGGLVAVAYRDGWSSVTAWFTAQTESVQIAGVVLAFVGVAASAQIVNRFDQTIVRVLEGYWPGWLNPLRARLIARQLDRTTKAERRFQELDRVLHGERADPDERTPEQLDEYVALDELLRSMPSTPSAHMPTRFGNLLRAAERRSLDKYGLDAIVCWPRLWLLLPDEARDGLSSSREALDASARACAWGLLFVVWTVWSWWAAPVGLLAALIAHRSMRHAAASYGDLIESAFDLYRGRLYDALRWPLPATPAEERALGQALTAYLWRGSDAAAPTFVVSQER